VPAAVLILVRWSLLVALAGLLSACGGSGPARRAAAPPAPGGGAPVAVTVGSARAGQAVPADFLGLSFESADLPQVVRARGLARFLRALGPGVMRFGGNSVDVGTPPASRTDLGRLARLARTTGWRVLLSLGLGRFDPPAAARQAAAARAALGDRLLAVAVGNEPDDYVAKGVRPAGWTSAAYRAEIAAYRRAGRLAPFAGPDASTGLGELGWVRAEAAAHPALLTAHLYPRSRCGGRRVTLRELLSARTRRSQSGQLTRLEAAARGTGAPLRIDETNSVLCRGQPGVSDRFGSALWAADYAAQAMDAGVAGLNFHDLLTGSPRAYSPLAASGHGGLRAAPEWYGLLLASRLIGERPVPARTSRRTLAVHAFAGPGGRLDVLLVAFGRSSVAVRLRLPGRYAVTGVMRLTARSPRASGGVALRTRSGAQPLAVPGYSAALVTLVAR
jgi:hypothetical protein